MFVRNIAFVCFGMMEGVCDLPEYVRKFPYEVSQRVFSG